MTSATERLRTIHQRIAKAAAIAARAVETIDLVAVTKGRSSEDIEPLIDSGQRLFGESRVQEATEKWPALLARHPDVRLHCIGRLQSNKAEDALGLFDVIHSLDRPSLLKALDSAATKTDRTPGVYVQVNIGDEPQKGGCAIDEVGQMVAAVRSSRLRLDGLMCIPPAGHEPAPYFALLADLARRHDVTGLSMGMSGDFESAIMLGATVVRVGSALFENQ
jgi:pyridoxal phosphate enzyme (YggS family)